MPRDKLTKSGLLYQVTERLANVDLHPDKITSSQMGLVFEELIRKFAEISNETAGEHFTPRICNATRNDTFLSCIL
jgi:type I restriction enzyme M protein